MHRVTRASLPHVFHTLLSHRPDRVIPEFFNPDPSSALPRFIFSTDFHTSNLDHSRTSVHGELLFCFFVLFHSLKLYHHPSRDDHDEGFNMPPIKISFRPRSSRDGRDHFFFYYYDYYCSFFFFLSSRRKTAPFLNAIKTRLLAGSSSIISQYVIYLHLSTARENKYREENVFFFFLMRKLSRSGLILLLQSLTTVRYGVQAPT